MAAGDEEWHTILFVIALLLFVIASAYVYYITSDEYKVAQKKRAAGHEVEGSFLGIQSCVNCCLGPVRRRKWKQENQIYSKGYGGKPDPNWEQFRPDPSWQRLPRGDTEHQRKVVAHAMAKVKAIVMRELLEGGVRTGMKLLKRDMEKQAQEQAEQASKQKAQRAFQLLALRAKRMEEEKAKLQAAQREAQRKQVEEEEILRLADELMLEMAAEGSDAEDEDMVVNPNFSDDEDDGSTGGASSGGANRRASLCIEVSQLKELTANQNLADLADEFSSIPTPISPLGEYPESVESYNRVSSCVPDLSTRVTLEKPLQGIHDPQYINANFISSTTGDGHGYIVTQAPLSSGMPGKESTIAAFFQMLWEQSVSIIVQLKEPAGRAVQYWPSKGEEVKHGDYALRFTDSDSADDYDMHSLVLVHNGEQRPVMHYLYTAWQDLPPMDCFSLLDMLDAAREMAGVLSGGPVVMMNETGMGSVGCLLAIEYGMFQIQEYGGRVDIPFIVANLRGERSALVETLEQYKFLYRALATYAQEGVPPSNSVVDLRTMDAGGSIAEVPQEEQPIQSAPDKLPPPSYVPTPKFDEDGHDNNIDGFAGMDLAPAEDPLGPPPDLAVPTEAVESQAPMVVEPVVAEVRRPSNHFPVEYEQAQAEFLELREDAL